MKHLSLLSLFALLAVACTTTDIEPEFPPDMAPSQLHSEKYLSSEEAGSIATAFMASLEYNGEKSRSYTARTVSDVSLLNTRHISRSSAIDTTFYLVNFEEGGYSLVAADRNLDNNIYVYSQTGTFNTEDNPVVNIYLENAIATMTDAPRRGKIGNTSKISRANIPFDPEIPAQGEVCIFDVWYVYYCGGAHYKMEPLLTTKWHQFYPYNTQCPLIGGKETFVGCVAIAMGQICSYHQWPEQLNGHTYNWSNMLQTPTHYSTNDIGLYDIAHILAGIGGLVDMNYGRIGIDSGSGSNIDKALSGFKKMGYRSVSKKKFSTSDCVYSLNGNKPVYMRGESPNLGGHAWVIDGYDKYSSWTDYYNKETGEFYMRESGIGGYIYLHFNYGWNNSSDAYYLCYGQGIVGRDDYKVFSDFDNFNKNNQIITIER